MIIIVFGQLEHQAVGNYIWHCICMQLSFNIQIYSASIVGGMQNASSSRLETSRASSAPVEKRFIGQAEEILQADRCLL